MKQVFLFFIGLALMAAPVFAQDPGAECDRLAANPFDTARAPGIAGLEFEKIDAKAAIAACEQAVAAAPQEPRFAYQLGRAYAAGTRYEEAAKLFRDLADRGHAAAQNSLGLAYEFGEGVPQDIAEAMKWYRLAADQGSSPGQLNVGLLQQSGQGGPPGAGEGAAHWFRLSADQGNVQAQTELALMLADGRGVAKNEAEALRLLRSAAERGYVQAQTGLGVMLALGRGTPENAAEAMTWLQRAADQNDRTAQFSIGVLYEEGRVPATGPGTGRDEAIGWYRRAAAQGHAGAKEKLAKLGVPTE